jgi:hypothetical protein
MTPPTIGHKAPPKPPVATTSGDAFSDLLESSLGSISQNGANLTIAERAALAEKAQREHLQKHQQSVKMQSSAWDGLDMLAKPLKDPNSDWGFGSLEPSKPASDHVSLTQSQFQEDDWGLSEFASPPVVSTRVVPAPHSQTILDLDDFSLLAVPDSLPPSKNSEHPPLFVSVEGSGFGDIGDKLLDNEFQDDDILGVLSKPVDTIPVRPSLSVSLF